MKKIIFMFFSIVMIFIVPVRSFAASPESYSISTENNILELPYCESGETLRVPVGNAEYIKDYDGNIIKISDLLSFESNEEYESFKEEFYDDLSNFIQINPVVNLNSRETHGDWDVASKNVGYGQITLRVIFTTSGNSNTGTITYHNAYTTFTGFTLGFGWDEAICTSEITSSGKAVYARAAGELTWNLLVDGFIELARTPVELNGYCYCVR